MLQRQDDRIILAPPSPPCSPLEHEAEKHNSNSNSNNSSSSNDSNSSSSSASIVGPSVTETLLHCDDDIDQAQRCLKDQYKRGVLLRSYTEPAPTAPSSSIMDCHRLAVEALQHLYVQERRLHTSSIKQADQANEHVAKLQQELAFQKRQCDAEHRKMQQEMGRVYELADTLLDISAAAALVPAVRRHRKQTVGSPAELHSRLRDILGNIISLQQCPSSLLDTPSYYERDYYCQTSYQAPY